MNRAGLTLDTGALIALERRKNSMIKIHRAALLACVPMTVSVAVIGEWWRGRTDVRMDILQSVRVEPLTDSIAKLAGEALGAMKKVEPGKMTIDAYVMASASLRGDVVYTSDFDDLEKLRAYFPSVRVLGIGASSS